MIKHHLKWKLPKQDVVQLTSEAKSTFYIARRLIQTKSDKSIKKIQVNEQPIEFAKITPATSRALTTSHYRSNSTTPSNFRAQQSKNFEELVQGFLTDRQQSNSIISTDLISNRFQKPGRVVSLYQITSQNTQNMQDFPNIDQVIENGKVENSSEFHSFKRMRSTRSDFNKFTKTESEIFDQVPCTQVKLQPQRRSIFLHTSYIDYKQKSKLQLKKNTQTNQKQQIFIQKVLKNIKDSQNENSVAKKFVRKYSKIWNENFSQTQFSEQQKYSKSQSQFKLYFNSHIEKTLNKFRLYQQITDLLNLINQYQNEMFIQLESMHDLRRLYLQNHLMRPIFSETIEDKQFRFEREISSFGMIEILDQVQDEIKDFFTLSSSSYSEILETKLQYFICQNVRYQTQYFITLIISTLDIMTKNKLLSVDYRDLDKQIYRSNVLEILPEIFSGNKIIQKFVAQKRYDLHFEILQGNFHNINQLEDIEHNNYYFLQKTQAQVQIDKKTIMNNLRKQTKDAKNQGRRSTLLMKSDFSKLQNKISKDDNIINSLTLNVPKQILSRRKSKSVQYVNLKQQEIEESETSFFQSDTQNVDLNSFKVKPVKYKQQLRLQNLMMFDHAIKKEFSAITIVEMMIEHNLVDELIDFLRQNPNFSLNQRNAEGKPLILLASQSGNIDVVQYMINQNVHLNVKDLDGNTPLHFAVAHRHYDVADLLLQNGANPFAKNRNNQNPWNWNMQLLQNQ